MNSGRIGDSDLSCRDGENDTPAGVEPLANIDSGIVPVNVYQVESVTPVVVSVGKRGTVRSPPPLLYVGKLANN